VAAAVAVVELGEHVHGDAEPLDVGQADPHAAGRLLGHRARIDQPPQRGVVPRAMAGPAPLQRGGVAQVGEQELRGVPEAPADEPG
jgi:hypothetical protein